jgi:hypothetical protein
MNAATPPPTLDMVASNPDCLVGQPPESLVKLLAQIAAVQSAVVAQLLAAPAADDGPDEWIKPEAAAAILKKSPRWIWKNQRKLPFVRRINARSLLCSRLGIAQWLDGRGVRS